MNKMYNFTVVVEQYRRWVSKEAARKNGSRRRKSGKTRGSPVRRSTQQWEDAGWTSRKF